MNAVSSRGRSAGPPYIVDHSEGVGQPSSPPSPVIVSRRARQTKNTCVERCADSRRSIRRHAAIPHRSMIDCHRRDTSRPIEAAHFRSIRSATIGVYIERNFFTPLTAKGRTKPVQKILLGNFYSFFVLD